MSMRLYNKSGRAFIFNTSEVVSGGRALADEIGKNRVYFDPQKNIEVTDEKGEKMLKDYPKEIMNLSEKSSDPVKRKVSRIKKRIGKSKAKG